jgi:hypothetical protein
VRVPGASRYRRSLLCARNAESGMLARGTERVTEVCQVNRVIGQFRITGGHEEVYSDRDPGRLTRSGGRQEFSGGIEGTGRIEWLMCYRADKTAEFVGIQEIDAIIDGRKGEIVLTSVGSHDGIRSRGSWTIVPRSGKGDLSGIVGNGTWVAGPGPQATFELSYELPAAAS